MSKRIRATQINEEDRRWWALGAMCFALFMIMLDHRGSRASTMPGYSATPLWKKLGLRAGADLLLVDRPRNWSIPSLPEGVTLTAEASEPRCAGAAHVTVAPADVTVAPADVIVAFFSELQALRAHIPTLAARIFPCGAIWIAWPRRAGGHDSDIRERDIRAAALPLGLVDVKVAALDEHRSGLRLVWRRERRQTPRTRAG